MKIKAAKLVFDGNLYPRSMVSPTHVTELAEALASGDQLPPLMVEKGTLRIIDGVHRWKAHRRVNGDDTEIECTLRSFSGDKEAFAAAIDAQTRHGLRLQPVEKTKCMIQAREMGFSDNEIARLFRVTHDTIERYQTNRIALSSSGESKRYIALKGVLRPLAGRTLTKAQQEANKIGGGMPAHYYVGQLISLLRAGLVDWTDDETVKGLHELRELLKVKLAKAS